MARGLPEGAVSLRVTDVASGHEALGAAVIAHAARAQDREWLQSPAARFWCRLAGIRPEEFERTVTAWVSGETGQETPASVQRRDLGGGKSPATA